jgi:hypothetical protein
MGGVTGDDIEIAPVERESGDGASLLMFVLNIFVFCESKSSGNCGKLKQ